MSFERGTLSANVMSRGEKRFSCQTLRGHIYLHPEMLNIQTMKQFSFRK